MTATAISAREIGRLLPQVETTLEQVDILRTWFYELPEVFDPPEHCEAELLLRIFDAFQESLSRRDDELLRLHRHVTSSVLASAQPTHREKWIAAGLASRRDLAGVKSVVLERKLRSLARAVKVMRQ